MIEVSKIDFDKMNGLIPTIIQEENGAVLSLIYSNKESLKRTLKTQKVWKYSRQKREVCMKGATSGNIQELIEARADCDNDALIFKVKQLSASGETPVACHTGAYSCFGEEKNFNLPALYEKIASRLKNAPSGSYTKTLFDDDALLKRKLIEEAAEVITAKNKKELVWECADLIYFLFVIMAKEGIGIVDIERENERRNNEGKTKAAGK